MQYSKQLRIPVLLFTLIGILSVQSGYAQSCSGFDPILGGVGPNNDLPPAGRCFPGAPVTIMWEVGYSNVDDGGDPNNVQFEITWGDGTNDLVTYDAFGGGINSIEELGAGTHNYRAFVDHTWPIDDVVCTYFPQVELNIVGVGTCNGTAQTQQYTVWGTDDQHGGQLRLEETGSGLNSFPVCFGTTANVTFSDNSLWNCTPPLELEPPAGNANNITRWIQIEYGTNSGDADFMTGVAVGGVVETYPFSGPVVVYNPTNIASTEITPLLTTPIAAAVNDRFEITIRYWNVCNPYDDGMAPAPGPNGDNAPVTEIAEIIIIDSPLAPAVPPADFCVGDNLSITAAGGAGVFNWYSDAGLGTLVYTGNPFNPSIDPPPAERLSNAAPGMKSYWVNETLATCVGPETQVDFEVFAVPVSTVGANFSLCAGTAILSGNDPAPYMGMWSTPGPATVDNPSQFDSGVTGLVAGSQDFTWTITNGPCMDAATITITRDALPSVADAGLDVSLCLGTSVTLGGTVPLIGTGTWSISFASLPGATFVDPNLATTVVNGLVAGETYTFRWEVVNGTCVPPTIPVNEDFVDVAIFLDPPANAGPDLFVCLATTNMQGVAPPIGVGTWTVDSGPGIVDVLPVGNANNPLAVVSGLVVGMPTVFRWEVINGVCIDSETVTVTRVPTAVSNPSSPSPVCTFDIGLTADPLLVGETGLWTTPGGGIIADPTNPNTAVSNIDLGNNDFTWEVTNACGPVSNMITVVNNNPPIADAGPDQSLCNVTSTILAATDPAPAGTGSWLITAGVGGSVGTPFAFNSVFNGVLGQTYTIEWTTTGGGGGCLDLTDDVMIQFSVQPLANAGVGGSICGKDAGNPFSLTGVASVGIGTWTNETPGVGIAIFADPNLATTSVIADTYGTYTFRWTEDNNTCIDFDEISVTYLETPIANAGPPSDEECSLMHTLGAIQSVGGSTGIWSVAVPGPGTISFDNVNLFAATATATLYGTYTLRFTESNGICSTFDDIVIDFTQQPVSNAGSGGSECDLDFQLGATPGIGVGTWSYFSGPGSITGFSTSANDPAALITVDNFGSYVFRWTEVNGGCNDFDDITVNFFQQPIADPGVGGTFCSNNTTLGANPSFGIGSWTYLPFDGSGSFDNPNLPNATFTGDFAKLYTLQWEEINGICIDNSTINILFDENPTPSTAGADQDICGTTTILDGNNPGVGMGLWTFLSNPDGNGMIANSAQFDSQMTGTPGITYSLQWTISNGICLASMDDVLVTFNPSLPITTINGDTDACVGDVKTYIIPGGNPALYTYTWDISALPPSTVVGLGSGTPFQFITLEFFDPTAVGLLGVTVQDKATLCTGPIETLGIMVSQSPIMSMVSSDIDGIICENESVTFTAMDALGIADFFEFVVNGSTVQSGTSNIYTTNSLPFINSITVIGTAPGGLCIAESAPPLTLTVNPIPAIFNVSGGGTYCEGGLGISVGLDGSEVGITYELFLDGVPTGDSETPGGGAFDFLSQTAAGIYTVTATSIANCGNLMAGNTSINVDPLPFIFNVTGGGEYCEGEGGLPIGVNNSEPGINYQLLRDGIPQGAAMPGTGAALDFGLQVFVGSYEVLATNSITFCSQNMLGTPAIIMTSAPMVLANNNRPVLCSDSPTDIELLSNLTDPTFTWTVIASSTSVTGATNETNPQPLGTIINQVIQNSSSFPQTVTYTISATGASPLFCPGETRNIEVIINPTMLATLSGSTTICIGSTTTLTFDIIGGKVPFDLTYTDGTSEFFLENIANNHVINVSPAITATYSIIFLTDAEGCLIDDLTESATIIVENPISDFTPDVNLEGCSALDIVFDNNDVQPGIIYEWSWGDGSPSTRSSDEQVMHSFVNNSSSPLSYTVTLTAINELFNCENTTSKVVEVLPSVNVEIEANTDQGCAPLLVSFTNNSLGVIDNKWYYRIKGTTDENEVSTTRVVTYNLPNTTTSALEYEVVYEAFNGFCLATEITDVIVYPNIEPTFTVSQNPAEVTTLPHVTVINTTPNLDSWTYLWEWGDGTTSTDINPGSHTYVNEFGLPISGSFEIRLTASFENENGICERITSQIFNVVPVIPIVDFEGDPLNGCRPHTVNFTNMSVGIDATTVLWEFLSSKGEVIGVSTAFNPSYTFYDAGQFTVRLTAGNSIGITETETKESMVSVSDLPTAGFTLRPDVVYLPDGIVYTQNQSENADEFYWIFNYLDYESGAGNEFDLVSTFYEPEIIYLREGFKDILLVATDSQTGCMDSSLVEKAVFVDDGGVARVPNAFTPSDRGPGAGNGSGNGTGGDGSFNETFRPYIDGLSRTPGSFHMQIFDRWGNMLFESWDQEIGWDGYNENGKLLPMGVYVYKLDLFFEDGSSTVRIGDVTLIR